MVADHWDHHPNHNIGLTSPERVLVIDVDPRSGGEESAAALGPRPTP